MIPKTSCNVLKILKIKKQAAELTSKSKFLSGSRRDSGWAKSRSRPSTAGSSDATSSRECQASRGSPVHLELCWGIFVEALQLLAVVVAELELGLLVLHYLVIAVPSHR